MPSQHTTATLLAKHRFTFLLVALVLLLIAWPQVEATHWGGTLFTISLTTVFITGVLANRERKWIFRGGLVVGTLAIGLSWTALFTHSEPLDVTQYLVVVFFSSVTAVMILISVVRDYSATVHAVVGAICVYLLIGLTWAMVYSTIEYIEDDPFCFPAHHRLSVVGVERTAFSQLTYFSFVTMSTLGYGDITPRTALAETACWMQTVVGQLYVATLIAKIVSELQPKSTEPQGKKAA